MPLDGNKKLYHRLYQSLCPIALSLSFILLSMPVQGFHLQVCEPTLVTFKSLLFVHLWVSLAEYAPARPLMKSPIVHVPLHFVAAVKRFVTMRKFARVPSVGFNVTRVWLSMANASMFVQMLFRSAGGPAKVTRVPIKTAVSHKNPMKQPRTSILLNERRGVPKSGHKVVQRTTGCRKSRVGDITNNPIAHGTLCRNVSKCFTRI